MKKVHVALIGDFSEAVTAHRAIPIALQNAARELSVEVAIDWLGTDQIHQATPWHKWDGIWVTPGSPYQSEEGALCAIRQARETQTPFLGTCGGFQHAILEYARNVLGWHSAQHAETHENADDWVIAPLTCSLVEVADPIRLVEPSLLFDAYRQSEIIEGYHCRFGLNPQFQERILHSDWRLSGWAQNGEVRALEAIHHPFFVVTLFQPERRALTNQSVPLAEKFLSACTWR